MFILFLDANISFDVLTLESSSKFQYLGSQKFILEVSSAVLRSAASIEADDIEIFAKNFELEGGAFLDVSGKGHDAEKVPLQFGHWKVIFTNCVSNFEISI